MHNYRNKKRECPQRAFSFFIKLVDGYDVFFRRVHLKNQGDLGLHLYDHDYHHHDYDRGYHHDCDHGFRHDYVHHGYGHDYVHRHRRVHHDYDYGYHHGIRLRYRRVFFIFCLLKQQVVLMLKRSELYPAL